MNDCKDVLESVYIPELSEKDLKYHQIAMKNWIKTHTIKNNIKFIKPQNQPVYEPPKKKRKKKNNKEK